jgi:hypothetical protein
MMYCNRISIVSKIFVNKLVNKKNASLPVFLLSLSGDLNGVAGSSGEQQPHAHHPPARHTAHAH